MTDEKERKDLLDQIADTEERLLELLGHRNVALAQNKEEQQKINDAAQAYNAQWREATINSVKAAEALNQIRTDEERRMFIMREEREELQEHLRILTMTAAVREREMASVQGRLDTLMKQREDLSGTTDEDQKKAAMYNEQITEMQERLMRLQRISTSLSQEDSHTLSRTTAERIRALNITEQHSNVVKQMIVNTTGVGEAWRKTYLGSIAQQFDALTNSGKSASHAAGKLLETSLLATASSFRYSNIIGANFMKVQEVTMKVVLEYDKARAELAKLTGGSQQYVKVVHDVYENNVRLGSSYSEVYSAVGALHSSFAGFRVETDQVRQSMLNTSIVAHRMGVDFKESAKTMHSSFAALGMTGDKTMRKLLAGAQSIQQAPTKYIQNFNSALDTLAAYSGPQAIEVFQGLSSWARQTQVSMSSLLSVAAKFDTFDGAAQNVGKLNAVLGGAYFNTLEMLNAKENERIELLYRGIQATGNSYNELDRWTKKAIASAAGFKSVKEASQIFSGDLSTIRQYSRQQESAADSMKKLKDSATSMIPIAVKLMQAMERLAPHVATAAQWLGRIVDFAGPLIPALVMLTTAMAPLITTFLALKTAMAGASLAAMAFKGTGLVALLTAAGYAASHLHEALTKPGSPPLYELLRSILPASLVSVGLSANKAQSGLNAIARPITAVGNALHGMSQTAWDKISSGFSSFSSGVSNLTNAGTSKAAQEIANLGQGLNVASAVSEQVSAKMATLPSNMAKANQAISTLSSTTKDLGGALNLVKVGNMAQLSRAFTVIGESSSESARQVVGSITSMLRSFNSVDEKQFNAFGMNIARGANSIQNTETEKIKNFAALTRSPTTASKSLVQNAQAVRLSSQRAVAQSQQAPDYPTGTFTNMDNLTVVLDASDIGVAVTKQVGNMVKSHLGIQGASRVA